MVPKLECGSLNIDETFWFELCYQSYTAYTYMCVYFPDITFLFM